MKKVTCPECKSEDVRFARQGWSGGVALPYPPHIQRIPARCASCNHLWHHEEVVPGSNEYNPNEEGSA